MSDLPHVCPDPALCERLRRHIAGRDWEWWTGQCPPERPCDDETRQALISDWELAARTLPTLAEQRELARKRLKARQRRPRWKRLQMFRTFLAALWRHLIHGLPYASPEDQAKRWAICEPCNWRDKEKNVCKRCGGCKVTPGQMVSKISWAQEQCPWFDQHPDRVWGPVKGMKIWRWAWLRFKALVSSRRKPGQSAPTPIRLPIAPSDTPPDHPS